MRDRPFCSDAARLRGDDNMASAARIDVWILVEFPGTWGRSALTDSMLPLPARLALVEAARAIPRSRVVLIRRRLTTTSGFRIYIARSAGTPGVISMEVPTLDDIPSIAFAAIAEQELPPPERPIVLVCTHGQHDSCCGRRGIPLYDALRVRDDIDVWQCSHIGGDRFAANAVVLPWGLFYGPVEPRNACEFADAVVRNEIFLPGYRGHCSMGRTAQAAETFVRRATEITGLDALRVIGREDLGEERTRVLLRDDRGTMHEVTLEHVIVAQNAHLTCSAQTPANVKQFRLLDHHTHDHHSGDAESHERD